MLSRLTSTTFAAIVMPLVVSIISLSPAHADAPYFRQSARSVAADIGCVNFRSTGGGGTTFGSGVCWLKGKRVNVLTYSGPGQQRSWNAFARFALGSRFYWASGNGATVVAKNGNRPAAAAGATSLPGRLVHG